MNARFHKALLALALPAILLAASCKKEEKARPPVADNPGDLKINVSYVWGPGNSSTPFELGQTYVHARTGDTLEFTTIRYYVSNIRLKNIKGEWWSHPDSYALMDMSVPNGSDYIVQDIPAGDYVEMEYTLGVDSEKNVTGAQAGALSPSNNMFWNWNTGYIMLKAEGYSPQADNGGFAFHLGGYAGEESIVTKRTTTFFGDTLNIKKGRIPVVKFQANPSRLWHNAPSVSERATIHMPGPAAVAMAKEFYGSFNYLGKED